MTTEMVDSIEVVCEDDEFEVLLDGAFVGRIWQMHKTSSRDAFHKVRSGSQGSWAAETADGVREWLRSREEALDWLVEQEL